MSISQSNTLHNTPYQSSAVSVEALHKPLCLALEKQGTLLTECRCSKWYQIVSLVGFRNVLEQMRHITSVDFEWRKQYFQHSEGLTTGHQSSDLMKTKKCLIVYIDSLDLLKVPQGSIFSKD